MKIEVTKPTQNTFKPIEISVKITIETKKDLKQLRDEFKAANLEDYNLCDGDNSSELEIISNIVKEIEENLD